MEKKNRNKSCITNLPTSVNYTPLVLKDLGEYEEAAHLLRIALDSDKKNFEPGHPSIALRQLNLASVLEEYEEAQELLQQASNSFLNKLGADHPHTKGAQIWLNGVIEAKRLSEQD